MKRNKAKAPDPDYQVGYGRPPRQTQFRSGKSGNPKGRPKESKSFRSIVDDVANLKVKVREGSRDRNVNVVQAGLLRLAEKVVAGDLKALATLLGLIAQHQPDQVEQIDFAKLSADDEELLKDLVARRLRGEDTE